MSRVAAAGLLVLTAAAAACSREGRANSRAGADLPERVVPVEVAEIRADSVVDAIHATGQIEAIQSIELRPEVEGRLVEIHVREGGLVTRGARLFKVDDAELRAQVARVEADRDLARQALDRVRQLLDDRAAAPADLERAEAQARSAQAQLDLLQVRLDRTTVRAPFTGVAGSRLVSLGDFVNSNTRLISLQTVHPQRATFQVPERYSNRLQEGQRVLFRVAAIPGRDFEGIVDFLDPQVQLPGRTIMVKATVPNPNRELQAGMFIEARLATEIRPDALVAPEEAVVQVAGGAFVWVVSDGRATRRPVDLGVRTPGLVEIRRGLEVGELVVVGGVERMTEGVAVSPTLVHRGRAPAGVESGPDLTPEPAP